MLTLYEYVLTLFRLDERARAYFAITIVNVLADDPADGAAGRRLDEGAEGLLLGSYAAGLPFLLQRIWRRAPPTVAAARPRRCCGG